MSIEPGWYFARAKGWSPARELVVVAVADWPGGGVVVWQAGLSEPTMTDQWEFGRRVYPDVENYT